MKYFGVIVDVLTKDTESIESEDVHKPAVEHGGMFCTCHWFKSEVKALEFEIHCLEVFKGMSHGVKA